MTPDIERAYIKDSIGAVTKAMGKAPAGWLGPGFAESMNTPNLLAAEGIRYVCDWSNDEQPYKMKVPQGELYSVGVDYDTDDIFIHWTGVVSSTSTARSWSTTSTGCIAMARRAAG